MRTNYDRKYDMPLSMLILDVLTLLHKRMPTNTMRRPRFELGCPKAPDPKSGTTPENIGFPSGVSPLSHTETPSGHTQSTTKSTTCAVEAARVSLGGARVGR